MLKRITVIAILIALMVSALPTANAYAAKPNNTNLEKKWDQLITNFNRQDLNHAKAHKWVENWLMTDKKAPASEKAEVARHLTVCNNAFLDAHAIVARHAGFNAKGEVIKPGLAMRSIKELSNALRAHAASVQKLQEHVK